MDIASIAKQLASQTESLSVYNGRLAACINALAGPHDEPDEEILDRPYPSGHLGDIDRGLNNLSIELGRNHQLVNRLEDLIDSSPDKVAQADLQRIASEAHIAGLGNAIGQSALNTKNPLA